MNKKYPTLMNAPIQEAVLGVRVQLPQNIALKDLIPFHELVKERFPNKRERVSFQSGFQFMEGKPVIMPPSGSPDGYLFESLKEKKIVQARLDGFTFNKLKPYKKLEEFPHRGAGVAEFIPNNR
ncbi:MAG: TIGR04255 family protein, partial [Proteobacteria bacterium]|nr:TIGR04255 family protein [Pseudomonadota bacterium]